MKRPWQWRGTHRTLSGPSLDPVFILAQHLPAASSWTQVVTVKPAFELPPLAAYRVSRCLRRRVLPGGWHGGNAALRPPCGLVFVDDSGLFTFAALRRARSLRPTTVRAVHFVIDGRHRSGFGPTGRQMLTCRWSWWIVLAGAWPGVPST